nr:hypothetical protein L203_04988 [Cryptococcus depauperatus CBS 7841]
MTASPGNSPNGKDKEASGITALYGLWLLTHRRTVGWKGNTMSLPLNTLSSLLDLQEGEDGKPRLSKISWVPDICVFRSSILPIVFFPVMTVTLFSAGVAAASIWWGKEVGLTNNVVPLLSVVVGLLLVFRNSSAYERYAEGRKDFTTMISIARNLSRNIWIAVTLPPPSADGLVSITREQLTLEKQKVIRLIVAFVVATKHHLRAEGGIHHDDLKGLLPPRLANNNLSSLRSTHTISTSYTNHVQSECSQPTASPLPLLDGRDEEALIGVPPSEISSSQSVFPSPLSGSEGVGNIRGYSARPVSASISSRSMSYSGPGPRGLKRRPTAVRIVVPDNITEASSKTESQSKSKGKRSDGRIDERTPLIKAGVKPDPLTAKGLLVERAEVGLGRMVELGLPLIIAHDISRSIFRFRRMGCLEAVGPAGMNALQNAVSGMIDQLGSMERIVQTPLPYIFCVHLKQVVSLYLFILPFTLVDIMGWKMVFVMFGVSMTFMGVEGIAAMIEQPFGTDPSDLNLDLYCTELLCECEETGRAILERLPEGEDDDIAIYERTNEEKANADYEADDGDDS